RGQVSAAMEGNEALASSLDVVVPAAWPPEFLDRDALQFMLDRLAEDPAKADWWMYFVVLREGEAGRTLIGGAGYKGPPAADGTLEVGYGIVEDHRRQGYASEACLALITRAFALPEVQRVIAETYPELSG